MTRNLIVALALLVSSGSWLGAQQLLGVGELYGEGVHKFFARDYQSANELLTQAIDSGSQDPRAYYFRGLAKEMIGGAGEADFDEGARLESAGRSGPMIGFSLARVQGFARTKLEKARRTARVQAAQQRALAQQSAPAVEAVPVPLVQPGASDPFKDGQGLRSDETQPAQPVPEIQKSDASTDPFADEPMKPDTAPATDDPFGTAPATDPGAASDPFGTAPATDPASAEDPFK